MKHLVITVSPDSSIDLLGEFADCIILDDALQRYDIGYYETIYIRSHFGSSATLPQKFSTEIESIVQQATYANPNIKIIDGVDTVDKILAIEDKWLQYAKFADFMPTTQRMGVGIHIADFVRPIYKNRLSSRGNGVTWDARMITHPLEDWIVQESIDIVEELRIYIIRGDVYPVGAVRQNKTSQQNTHAVGSRRLTQKEIDFASHIHSRAPDMDIVGIDVACTADDGLYLMEANRSPGFAAFAELTNVNLARLLYAEKQ